MEYEIETTKAFDKWFARIKDNKAQNQNKMFQKSTWIKGFGMKETIRKFDVSEHLSSPEMIREYLQATLEEGDVDLLKIALGNVAKAKGMTDIAKATNLSRQHLYRALSENGSPQFDTIVKVLQALDCQLSIKTA